MAGQEVSWQQLDALRAELSVELFGGSGWSAAQEQAADPRVIDVLDVFHAMELLDPDEPAFSWNRAGLLCDLGHYSEAAEEFLEAARKLDAGIADGWIGPDEGEWGGAARAYASTALLLAEKVTSAAVLMEKLSDSEDRDDVRSKIELALRDGVGALDPIEWIPHPRWQDLKRSPSGT
jgi:hypothetical protein